MNEDSKQVLLKECATAIGRTWAYWFDDIYDERQKNIESVHEMNSFARQHIPLLGQKGWSLSLRTAVFFSHYNNFLAFWSAWFVNRLVKKLLK